MKYIARSNSNYKNRENKAFDLHVLTSDDLSTKTHIYVSSCRKNGLQGMSHFRNGLKLIKSNKQGRYFEISNGCIFIKTRIYL